MCNEAIRWAWSLSLPKNKVRKSSLKMVLVRLADFANEKTFLAWPTANRVANETGLDVKTVRDATDVLEELGMITDTGGREGDTGMVKVYRVNIEDTHFVRKGHPKNPAKAPNFHRKDSRNRETEPIPNPDSTIKEPKEVASKQTRKPIDHILSDSDRAEARRNAPRWDLHHLCEKYDEWSADKEMPQNRARAFIGWVKKFTKGKPPAGYRKQFGDSFDDYDDDF